MGLLPTDTIWVILLMAWAWPTADPVALWAITLGKFLTRTTSHSAPDRSLPSQLIGSIFICVGTGNKYKDWRKQPNKAGSKEIFQENWVKGLDPLLPGNDPKTIIQVGQQDFYSALTKTLHIKETLNDIYPKQGWFLKNGSSPYKGIVYEIYLTTKVT